MLNAPRQVGGADLITFANHWAVVQAYYAVFEALNAVVLVGGSTKPAEESRGDAAVGRPPAWRRGVAIPGSMDLPRDRTSWIRI